MISHVRVLAGVVNVQPGTEHDRGGGGAMVLDSLSDQATNCLKSLLKEVNIMSFTHFFLQGSKKSLIFMREKKKTWCCSKNMVCLHRQLELSWYIIGCTMADSLQTFPLSVSSDQIGNTLFKSYVRFVRFLTP